MAGAGTDEMEVDVVTVDPPSPPKNDPVLESSKDANMVTIIIPRPPKQSGMTPSETPKPQREPVK